MKMEHGMGGEMEIEISTEKKEPSKYGKYSEWEVECAARTLQEAEEIKSKPELVKFVKDFLGKKIVKTKKAIESLDDLRALAKGSEMEESEEYGEAEEKEY